MRWNVASSFADQVPEAILNEYNHQLKSGFAAWTSNEFNTFLELYLEHNIQVADHIDYDSFSKTKDEVQKYLMVFVDRYEEAGVAKFIE